MITWTIDIKFWTNNEHEVYTKYNLQDNCQWTNTILIEEFNNIKYKIFIFVNTEYYTPFRVFFRTIIYPHFKQKEIKIEINTSKEVICKRLIYRYHMQIIHYIDMQ